jgi:chromate transporter
MSVGGAITVAPDMERLLVGRMGLLTPARFSASIAIAQAAPGPNALYVAVLGYQAAGLAGAGTMLVAYMLPSSALAFAVGRWAEARHDWRAFRAFKAGMAPFVIGLLLAAAWTLMAAMPGWRPVVVAAGVALATWRTRIHLLWLMGAGALLGALGWL